MPEIDSSAAQTTSVVICTCSRPNALRQALQALQTQDLLPTDVVVVENGPKDIRVQEAAAEFGAKYLYAPQAGLSLARNQGLIASRSDVVAFIDDDCTPEKTWLSAMTKVFEDPAVMAAGGRIVPPDGAESCRALCMYLQGEASLQAEQLDAQDKYWFRKAAFGGLGTGGNMALRRSLISRWTGFDERLGLPHSSCEDLYAFLSIVRDGHRIAYVPEAVVCHPCPMPEMAELQKRVSASTAIAWQYFMFLFFEAGGYRIELLKFLAAALGKRLVPTKRTGTSAVVKISIVRQLVGAVRGIKKYFLSRAKGEVQTAPLSSSS